jgi:PhoPQ-activated pathogenicity-related protein
MKQHFMALGGWSRTFEPYWEEGLTELLDTQGMREISCMIDPLLLVHEYNARNVPIYSMTGSGDEFFLHQNQIIYENVYSNLYLNMVPNKGHNLGEDQGNKLRAFYYNTIKQNALPKISWTRSQTDSDGTIVVKIENGTPSSVSAWHADTSNRSQRDFRSGKVTWVKSDGNKQQLSGNEWSFSYTVPSGKYRSFYVSVDFANVASGGNGASTVFTLTTTPVIMPDTFPFAECHGAGCKGQLLDFGSAFGRKFMELGD